MKKILITLLIVVSANKAQAKDLTDFMSPDQMAAEINREANFEQIDHSQLFWRASSAQPRLQIIVNKAQQGEAQDAQTLEAFVDGELLYRATVSTGKETVVTTPDGGQYRASTPRGTFKITWRSRNHKSKKWGGASMPFAQFFVGGIAIHATTPDHFSKLGQRDSGGCVRLHPRDAELMWNMVDRVGTQEVEITVYDGSRTAHPLGRSGETPKFKVRELDVRTIQPAPIARGNIA